MSEKRYQVDIRQAGALATRAGTIIGGLDDDLDGMHAPAAHLWAVAQDLRNALTLTVHSLAELLAGGDATSPNFLGPDLDLGADAQHDRPVVGFDCDEISFDRAVELLHDLVGCGVGDRELLLSVVEARVRHGSSFRCSEGAATPGGDSVEGARGAGVPPSDPSASAPGTVPSRDLPAEDEHRWASLNEAAAYVGLSRRTIEREIADGRLARHKIRRRALVDLDELDELIEGPEKNLPPTVPAVEGTNTNPTERQ